MKKSFVIILAALCVAAFMPQALQAGVGLKGGYSWSRLTGTAAPIPGYSIGDLRMFTGGISFNLGLGFISIGPEFLYTRMGAGYSLDPFRTEFRLDYIQVPVLLKIKVIPAGPLRPFICGGVYGSYLIKAEGIQFDAGVKISEGDIADNYERYDYGAVGGAGIALHLPGITLTAEGRYNLGLKNILKDPLAGESVKNRSIMVLSGIAF